jgi:glycine betaine catabolism A
MTELIRTLPGPAYTSTSILEWELDHFFHSGWICVGRDTQLPDAGDQRAFVAGGQSLLMVRDSEGALRCFYNVCRHRAHELLPVGGAGHHHFIRCPYHAWAYRLDGSLRATPNFDDLPDDDPVRSGLVPVAVAGWHGWIFVNPTRDAVDVVSFIDDLDDLVRPYAPEGLVSIDKHSYEVRANWKVIVENYHECLHCPSIHPQLVKLSASDSGTTCEPRGMWAGGTMELRDKVATMSLTGKGGRPLPGISDSALRDVVYVSLFPNLLLSMHPDYVMTHRLEPLAPDRTFVECEWLSLPETRDEDSLTAAVEFWDVTNRQDWAACESVQRGVASPAYRPGPLGYQEGSVAHFVEMVRRGYRAGGLDGARLQAAASGY